MHIRSQKENTAVKVNMVTINSIKKRLDHHRRLRLAGMAQPEMKLGPAVILWVRSRDGSETWEVLPEWVADLLVSDLHNDPAVERAAVYHRIPKNAPLDVAAQWLQARTGRTALTPDAAGQILAA